jgi:RHS repeat-associated protein
MHTFSPNESPALPVVTLRASSESHYRARYYDQSAGRFLNEDPTGFRGGSPSFYSYVANSPPNLKDTIGLDYSTSYNNGVITISSVVTIIGPGASDELAAKWKHAIETAWNKNPGYGKCKVVFDVDVNTDWTLSLTEEGIVSGHNLINVPADHYDDPHADWPYYNTGSWGFDLLDLGVAHEFGHLLGLWDVSVWGKPLFGSRNPNDIMNSKSEVTPYDIESIIGMLNKFRCRCD